MIAMIIAIILYHKNLSFNDLFVTGSIYIINSIIESGFIEQPITVAMAGFMACNKCLLQIATI